MSGSPFGGPETYEARNRIIVLGSGLRYPTPGMLGRVYASGTPSTARDSEAENVRSPMR